ASQRWVAVLAAEEGPTEVVQRSSPTALLADDRVCLEPNKQHLLVIVPIALSRSPFQRRLVVAGKSRRSVADCSPCAAWSNLIHQRGDPRDVLSRLFWRAQSAARAQHQITEITGHPFVSPQQIVNHRLLIVVGGEACGSAVLPVPGVHIFMRNDT